MEIIKSNPQKCIACNACIRICPAPEACVPATTPEGKNYVSVNSANCIYCGECIRKCPHGARDFEDDYEDFIEDMYSKKGKLSLLVDPSIRVAFPDVWQDVLKWFYTQGVRKIYDVSFGADIATWAQLRSASRNSGKYISSSCSSVISYAEKHNNELLEKLSPVHSPAMCMALYAKFKLKDTSEFAYLGPCPGRKDEFNETGLIQYNVTFTRMKEYFQKRQISFTNTGQGFNFEFTHRQGLMGALYCKPKGLKENLHIYRPESNIANVDGISKTYYQLNIYNTLESQNYIPDIFEVLSCEEGCNGGIGINIDRDVTPPGVISRVMDITRKDAEKRQNGLFNLGNKGDRLFKEFDKELKLDQYMRNYEPKRNGFHSPTIADLNDVFSAMLKFTDSDKNINCGACGNNTCREMAVSVFHRTNVKENCIYYSRNISGNDSVAVAGIKNTLDAVEKIVKENMPSLADQVAIIRKEAVAIYSNNDKTAEAAKTINKVITQMIDACNNPKGVSRETISEISSTLELIRKIILNLDKFVTKNSESGYTIDKCVTAIDDISRTIQGTVENITANR